MPRSVYLPQRHMSASPREQFGQPSGLRTLATTAADSESCAIFPFARRAGRLTRPKLSCPRIKKSEPGGASPYSPRSISASVPQSPTRTTSTTTSSSFGTGSGTSRTTLVPGFLGITASARIRAEYVAMPITPAEVERIFRGSGALRDGHFVLASGRHSPTYLEKFQVLGRPVETERLCGPIADWARPLDLATVAGPTTGGVILAHEVARELGLRAGDAERGENEEDSEFPRGVPVGGGGGGRGVDQNNTTEEAMSERIGAVKRD